MSAHSHSEDGHDFAHPMPVPILLAVFFALTFLTIVTVAQASFDFGAFEVAVVMFEADIGSYDLNSNFVRPYVSTAPRIALLKPYVNPYDGAWEKLQAQI